MSRPSIDELRQRRRDLKGAPRGFDVESLLEETRRVVWDESVPDDTRSMAARMCVQRTGGGRKKPSPRAVAWALAVLRRWKELE